MTVTEPALAVEPIELDDALRRVLRRAGYAGEVRTIHRRANIQTSTFPSDVVTCRWADGRELSVFCKYSDLQANPVYGHRSGVAFEAMVYDEILTGLPLTFAACYGHVLAGPEHRTVLFLEALDEIARVEKSANRDAIVDAARWIGRFHALNESRAASLRDRLHRYSPAYYAGWAQRTNRFAEPLREQFPWLSEVCRRAEEAFDELQRPPLTVIHGEYYPKNILERDGRIYPVDWESAAVAAGEVDLASLTENWPTETIARCAAAYVAARWPGHQADAPDRSTGLFADFERRMDLASLYLHFRWLGTRPDWTTSNAHRWRFPKVQELAVKLGIV